jgi:hypothetical protein
MLNEYIREYKIGSGSYGKVVSKVLVELYNIFSHWAYFSEPLPYYSLKALYRSSVDGKHYAIKVRPLLVLALKPLYDLKVFSNRAEVTVPDSREVWRR